MTKHVAVFLLASALLVLSIASFDRSAEPIDSRAWSVELVIDMGAAQMDMAGVGGVTYVLRRPVLVLISPNTLDQGGPYLAWVMRHELLHTIGWLGHPHATPDDDIVVYMDRSVPAALLDPEPGSVFQMPRPSAMEAAYVRQSPATVWVSVADGDLVASVEAAVAFWNGVAGRELFRMRVTPATMK